MLKFLVLVYLNPNLFLSYQYTRNMDDKGSDYTGNFVRNLKIAFFDKKRTGRINVPFISPYFTIP